MDGSLDRLKTFLREPKPPATLAREFEQVRILSNSRRLKAISWLMIIGLAAFTIADCLTIDPAALGSPLSAMMTLRAVALAACCGFIYLFGRVETVADLKPHHQWLWLIHIHFSLIYTAVIVGVMFRVKETIDPVYLFLLGPAAFLSLTRAQAVGLQLVGLVSLATSLAAFVPESVPVKFHLINICLLSWISLVVARITYGGSLREFMNRHAIEQANRELETARVRAEAGSRAKSEFLASVSHEIRTPMNSILGMLEVVLHTPLSSEQRDFVSTARESATHLLDILGDILDFSRIEAGSLRLIETHFDLPTVFQSAMRTVRLQAEQKGLSTEFEIMSDTPRFLKGDPGRLRQVLINLLNNAVKFTEKGSVRVTVGVWAEGGTDPDRPVGLRFSVRDTGVGIGREKLRTIFDAFSQVDGSSSRTYGGSGLGLSICKELVERMGGTLTVSSKEGRGSEFVFTARFGHGDGERAVEPDVLAASWNAMPPLKPARVLLVEDNPFNVKVEKLHLDKLGMDATVAQSGTEALMLLAENDYDLVLMDLEMPGMDGHETTRRIRSGEGAGQPVRQPDIPIVALTAHALADVRRRCEEGGMNGFVAKPAGMGDLAAAMRRVLGVELRGSSAVPRPVTEGPPVLNLDLAASALGVSKAEVRHMLPNALEEIALKTDLAERGVNSGTLRETTLQAHTLKSVTATIGAEAARQAAVKLENASRRNDISLANRRLVELKMEVTRLGEAAKAL